MREKPFSKMRFYTAAEVAEILKVNHQVLVRKLQAGEIPAYKIGKDWRIEEGELQAWLRAGSNRQRNRSGSREESVVRNFFEGGRLKEIPARRSKREIVLKTLAQRFRKGRVYSETEVNEILGAFHPDFCTLRRELVMGKHLEREGGRYWRPSGVPSGEEATAEPETHSS
jgi:excisionase family DNA binding protein